MCGLSTVVTPAGASLTMYREIRSYANSIWDDNNNNNNKRRSPGRPWWVLFSFVFRNVIDRSMAILPSQVFMAERGCVKIISG